jgi:hypothetical protein
MKAIIYGALMTLTITTAHAAEVDRNSADFMLPYCKGTKDQVFAKPFNAHVHGRCSGLIEGTVKMLNVLKHANDEGRMGLPSFLCVDIPDNVTIGQAREIVVKYLDAHPQDTHKDFQLLALTAWREAWPCNDTKPPRDL